MNALAALFESAINELGLPLAFEGDPTTKLEIGDAAIDRNTGEVLRSHSGGLVNYLGPWLRYLHRTLDPTPSKMYPGATKTTYCVARRWA